MISAPIWITEFLGRLHPMVVHFPIGVLYAGLILEGISYWKQKDSLKDASLILMWVGCLTALSSILFGQLLWQSESYGGQIAEQHRIAGFITFGLSCISLLIFSRRRALPRLLPLIALAITVIALTFTGHWGAHLTHGTDYLSIQSIKDQDEGGPLTTYSSLASLKQKDSLSLQQLDQLNLDVRAIFAHNCYQCHSTAKKKGGLALDHQEGVFSGGEHGEILVKGKAEGSEVIKRLLLPRDHEDAMPPKGKKLPKEEIELIAFWIDQGAHWADASLKIFREAPLALTKPPVPKTSFSSSHPIDQFIDQYFEKHRLDWPDRISDHRFIRKVYLDLLGLLPSPSATDQFVSSDDPQKYAQLIDNLLADSTQYAVHWMGFWNDLLRNDYSGTGFITGGRKQISDWIYQSLYLNKPYDLMVKELVNPDKSSEGFIKGIQWRGTVNASQKVELQAAQNISQSLLGLNLKCASCHNSFINNLSLDQAYGFANIFSEEPLEIYRCDKPTGRMARNAFIYPELGSIEGDSVKARLASLAEIMVQPANGRLSRTLVNRLWDKLFGRGFIATVDDMDQLPWSQELLDWISADFVEHEYDIKRLLKTMMTAYAYQLSPVEYPSESYVISQDFIFEGPLLRRITAEQFADACSKSIAPLYQAVDYDPTHRSSKAQWIWHKEIELDRVAMAKPGLRLFKRSFAVEQPSEVIDAKMLITVDHRFECFLNGEFLAAGTGWKNIQELSIPLSLIKANNTLAIKAWNDGQTENPAGILLDLKLEYDTKEELHIVSDRSFFSSADTLMHSWMKEESKNDSSWQQVQRVGSFEKSYWGKPIHFQFGLAADTFARANLVKLDPFMKALGRPSRENVTTRRSDEATLLQALMLTNQEVFNNYLKTSAISWLERYPDQPEALIDQLFLLTLGRLPQAKERKLLLKDQDQQLSVSQLQDIMWSILLLPEFQFI